MTELWAACTRTIRMQWQHCLDSSPALMSLGAPLEGIDISVCCREGLLSTFYQAWDRASLIAFHLLRHLYDAAVPLPLCSCPLVRHALSAAALLLSLLPHGRLPAACLLLAAWGLLPGCSAWPAQRPRWTRWRRPSWAASAAGTLPAEGHLQSAGHVSKTPIQ